MIALTMSHDLRAPVFGAPAQDLYKAALDQTEWADRVGFHVVSFLEHHASSDGYLPSPLIAAAAAAGRTKNVLIGVVYLLPMHDPIRAAEDLAVLDLVSGGRLRLTVAAGYRAEEYALFGLNMKNRPSLMERSVDVLKKAWSGEPFEYEGKTIQVLPRPHQRPHPAIIMGGSTKAAAERAARIADGFGPVVPELYHYYADALRALGKPVPEQAKRRGTYLFLHVSHNPAEAWKAIGPHAMHCNNEYAGWLKDAPNAVYHPVSHPDELLAHGTYKVVTPDECVALAREDGALSVKPLVGGLDPAIAWESLRLIETEVLPRLR